MLRSTLGASPRQGAPGQPEPYISRYLSDKTLAPLHRRPGGARTDRIPPKHRAPPDPADRVDTNSHPPETPPKKRNLEARPDRRAPRISPQPPEPASLALDPTARRARRSGGKQPPPPRPRPQGRNRRTPPNTDQGEEPPAPPPSIEHHPIPPPAWTRLTPPSNTPKIGTSKPCIRRTSPNPRPHRRNRSIPPAAPPQPGATPESPAAPPHPANTPTTQPTADAPPAQPHSTPRPPDAYAGGGNPTSALGGTRPLTARIPQTPAALEGSNRRRRDLDRRGGTAAPLRAPTGGRDPRPRPGPR